MAAISAGVGAYIHTYTELGPTGLRTFIESAVILISLFATSTLDNGKNRYLRLGCHLGFFFFLGMGVGPLFDVVIDANPSIIVTALLGTAVILASFSLSAIFAGRGSWLFLRQTLMAFWVSLLFDLLKDLYFGSDLRSQSQPYLTGPPMCCFFLTLADH
jgi:hypothetical protein